MSIVKHWEKHFWPNWEKWLSNTTTDSESLQAFNINNEDQDQERGNSIKGNGKIEIIRERKSQGEVMQSETLHLAPPLGARETMKQTRPGWLTTSSQFCISLLLLWHWIESRDPARGEEISQNVRYEWLMGRLGVQVVGVETSQVSEAIPLTACGGKYFFTSSGP